MNSYLLPIIAVILGIVLAIIGKTKPAINTKLLLSFSGAFLLALTLFELLPEVYHHLESKQTGLFIMLGILLQIVLEFFSKGAEHGHVHIHKNDSAFPWLLFISLCIHSFLEGFPIHHHSDMVYGVLIHKIPIAALITTYLIQSHFSKTQLVIFLTIFTIMTPLGTFISNHVTLIEGYIYFINAIVIGIFFHISTTILFESNEDHKFNLTKLISILAGVAIAYAL
ncbi:ZIP family metal transporter [Formosa algae]|uniref:Zinc transporter ZupT n=1 Tax=Formosa algae TaxID=225843 RepID=A0A9X0YQE3_9FLAO|nr:ZIP family metal transporter [Formosa algae]MBP1841103.1 zinc transporter ZupT [Formosa algae]MDQ0336477.1 zinc transporter ZupT [Formosa algae]OEI81438.1 ZIP family metal transporter [Formosa algae]PNW26586.1 ZIP family metal transporter [Formosa algae]